MRIVANRPEHRPARFCRDAPDRICKSSGTPCVASWHRLPLFPDWFVDEGSVPVAFRTANRDPEFQSGAAGVCFIDGRHRTRWLMGRFSLVAVGLEQEHFGQAAAIGLAARAVDPGDTFPTGRGMEPAITRREFGEGLAWAAPGAGLHALQTACSPQTLR